MTKLLDSMVGRPERNSGQMMMPITRIVAMMKSRTSVQVARKFPAMTPSWGTSNALWKLLGFSVLKKKGRSSVGGVKSNIGWRMAASSSGTDDDFTMPDRNGLAVPVHGDTTTSNWRSSASLVTMERSSSVSGWFDTINVATFWLDSMAM